MASRAKRIENFELVDCRLVLKTYFPEVDCTYLDIETKTFEKRLAADSKESLRQTKYLIERFLHVAGKLEEVTRDVIFPHRSLCATDNGKLEIVKWYCKVHAYTDKGNKCLEFSEITKEEAKAK